jgi:hypothetical protein
MLENVTFQIESKRYDLNDYLALNRVAGLLILKSSKVVLEDYELGPSRRRDGRPSRWQNP